MVIRKAHRFFVKLINLRRLDVRVTGTPQIAVALVIRQHKDHIGTLLVHFPTSCKLALNFFAKAITAAMALPKQLL